MRSSNSMYSSPLPQEAESVLGLLIAQCGDLENLLALARREEAAAQAQNFDELLQVVSERTTLGERLEVYHRQIADLRNQLGVAAAFEQLAQSRVAQQTTALVHEIQATDARTQPLLLAARSVIQEEQQRLERSQRGVNAYLREGRFSCACDQRV